MRARVDLTGKRFGHLVVTEAARNKKAEPGQLTDYRDALGIVQLKGCGSSEAGRQAEAR